MEQYELQKLRDLPIEGVAERLGIVIGRYHKALCPFHADKHPSLSFNVRRNTCRCFVCMDSSMGTIDLTMQYLHKDFRDACEWLAREHNVILSEKLKVKSEKFSNSPILENRSSFDASKFEKFFEHPYLSPEARHFLFDERHLDERVVRWCRLNSFKDKQGTNWLQIPYFDQDGKLVGVQSRNLSLSVSPKPLYIPPVGGLPNPSVPRSQVPSAEESSPFGGNTKGLRFKFPPGSRCSIYNLPVLKMLKPGEDLWIAEGCSDCWSLLSSGHKAIAIPSATLLKTSDFEQLSTLNSKLSTTLHMYPDQDAPGERLFLQLQELALRLGLTLVRHQLPPGCKDYSDFFVRNHN